MIKSRGYFAIGIYHTKTIENVGTLWRSAHNFGAAFIFTIGQRYRRQASDTTKATRHIPLYEYKDFDDFHHHCPAEALLVGIEQNERAVDLAGYKHPERAIYLLGAEDHGLSTDIIQVCNHTVSIGSPMCLNVAVAGSIVMYDRASKH